jgi:DNA-binding MarR family transcriptional regulator
MVAAEEGKGVNAYARAMGIHRAAVSRYLRDIGDRARNGGPGLGLITVKNDPADPIRSQVFLTPKGRSIAKQIFRQIRKAR